MNSVDMVSTGRQFSRSSTIASDWLRAWTLQEVLFTGRVYLADALDDVYCLMGILDHLTPLQHLNISYVVSLRPEQASLWQQHTRRRRHWVTAPGRIFSGSWDRLVDSVDITQTPRLQIQDSQTAQASTCVQQGSASAVQRQTQRIEQLDFAETEQPSQNAASRQLWVGVVKAAGARVKSFNKASTEEVKKKPIATIGVVAAVVALVYTVASHAI